MFRNPDGVVYRLFHVFGLFNTRDVFGDWPANISNGCLLKADLPNERRGPHELGRDLPRNEKHRNGVVVAVSYSSHHVVTTGTGSAYRHSEALDLGIAFSHETSGLLVHGADVL